MKITAIYDNGGKTIDRFTVMTDVPFNKELYTEQFNALGLDDNGGHSFSQWGSAIAGRNLGRKVRFEELNAATQKHIAQRLFGEDEK